MTATQYPWGKPHRRYLPSGRLGWIILASVVAAIIGLIAMRSYFETKSATVVVHDKERVCDRTSEGGSDCKYLVFTDEGTFRLTDSLVIGRFNSSDAYGQIKRCHRYEVDYYGWRFGLTSSYPNIKDMEDLGRVEGCET